MSQTKAVAKTWTLKSIKQSVDPEKEIVAIENDFVTVYENKPPHRMKMLFKKAGHRYVKFDIQKTMEFIVSKLAPHVDVKRFLKELLLLYSPPEEIEELKERLEKGYAKISQAKQCYSLMIGGKTGKPYEFNLVG